MLARVWRKGNAHALLMRMYIGVATMENSLVDTQKIKTELPYNLSIHPCIYMKKAKILIWKHICTPYTHCSIIYSSNNLSVHWEMNKEDAICDTHTHTHTHNEILLSHRK